MFVLSDLQTEGLRFGNYRDAEVHGRKFHDLNADGVHDALEAQPAAAEGAAAAAAAGAAEAETAVTATWATNE